MEKNRIELAKNLGLKVKVHSETPGIYLKTDEGKRELKLEDVFSELNDLIVPSISITTSEINVISAGKVQNNVKPQDVTFKKSDMLIGAS